MNRTIIVVSALFGIFLGSFLGTALEVAHGSSAPNTTVVHSVPERITANLTNEVIPVSYNVPEMKIIVKRSATVHAKKVAAPKETLKLVCGEFQDNLVGGRNRNCFWK